MPCDLFAAINHAWAVLSWHEHLSEDEQPPRWMWELPDELEAHFDWVKQERRSGTSRDDDEPSGPMTKNELARGRGRELR